MKTSTKVLTNLEAKKLFESIYKPVSDRTWYRIKKVFSKDFEMTRVNVEFIAKVKLLNPVANIQDLESISNVHKFRKFEKRSFTGKDVKNFFKNELKIVFADSTFSKWFKPLGGFKADKVYPIPDLYPVILAGIIQLERKRYEKAKIIQQVS